MLHVVRRGYQYKAGFLDGIKREVITIYEILRDSANNLLWAVPDYQFTCVPFCLPHSIALAGSFQFLCLPTQIPWTKLYATKHHLPACIGMITDSVKTLRCQAD